MNLSLDEMEREAYQRGDCNRAELLRLAIERQAGADEEFANLEQEAESERERADEAEVAMDDLCTLVGKHLAKIEDGLEAKDMEAVHAAIKRIREEI